MRSPTATNRNNFNLLLFSLCRRERPERGAERGGGDQLDVGAAELALAHQRIGGVHRGE